MAAEMQNYSSNSPASAGRSPERQQFKGYPKGTGEGSCKEQQQGWRLLCDQGGFSVHTKGVLSHGQCRGHSQQGPLRWGFFSSTLERGQLGEVCSPSPLAGWNRDKGQQLCFLPHTWVVALTSSWNGCHSNSAALATFCLA